MADGKAATTAGPYDAVARKWLALAERRRAYLVELRASGRWRHYLLEVELENQLREATAARDRFARVAGVVPQAASVPPAQPHPAASSANAPAELAFEDVAARALRAAAGLPQRPAKSAA